MKILLSQRAFFNALGTVVYTTLVAWFLYNGKALFDGKDSFFIPLFMLLLLIISATVTGLLVLGKPIQFYLEAKKSEANRLLLQTLGWIIVFIALVVLFLWSH